MANVSLVFLTLQNEVVDEDAGTTYKSLSKWARTVKGYSSINVFTDRSLVTENNDEDNDYDSDEYVDVDALKSKKTKYFGTSAAAMMKTILDQEQVLLENSSLLTRESLTNGHLIYGAAISRHTP